MSTEQEITHNIQAINPNLDKLKQAFPHCFDKNGAFDFAKFKAELDSSDINIAKEGYSLNWLGKSYARVLASDAATTLLKEDEAHNTKPENANSQNLLIKGDNLEVLKHLSNAYYEKVKMIYIDPPYNTGSDGFVYNDDRKFTANQLQDLAGVSEDEAKRILEFTQSNSNSHSAWLTFMYPRLYIAKQLLKDDGVIFVSIDDNEVAQLRLLMDEVFGEENFVAILPTIMNLKGNNDEFGFSGTHEYSIVYSKNKSVCEIYEFDIEEEEQDEWLEDEIGFYKKGAPMRATGEEAHRDNRPFMFYPILFKDNTLYSITQNEYECLYDSINKNFNDENLLSIINEYEKKGFDVILPKIDEAEYGRWRWGFNKENIERLSYDVIVTKTNKGYTLYKKQRPELGELPTKKPKSIFYKPEYSSGNGTSEIKKLFTAKVFSNPKPSKLLYDFFTLTTEKDSLILDFFAGSGTAAHSVMQLNAEDGGNRKFVLVQLPEPIDAKKSKVAYDFVKEELGVTPPTIFEITKERIIRAAKQINAEIDSKIEKLKNELPTEENKAEIAKNVALKTQNSFKIFETTPLWEDYDFKAEKLANAEKLFDDNKLTEADIKALFTTWKTYDGSPLTEPVQEVDLAGYKAYYTKQKLYLMHKGFSTATLKALLEHIDADANFNPTAIIAFGYYFESKALREIAENIKTYNNKKNIDIDFITRY